MEQEIRVRQSSVNTAEFCQTRAWHYYHNEGIRSGYSASRDFGVAVHVGVTEFLNCYKPNLSLNDKGILKIQSQNAAVSELQKLQKHPSFTIWYQGASKGLLDAYPSVDELIYGLQDAVLSISNYLEDIYLSQGWTIWGVEKTLRSEVLGFQCQGTPDLVLQNSNGEFLIIDFKTCGNNYTLKKYGSPEKEIQPLLYVRLLSNETKTAARSIGWQYLVWDFSEERNIGLRVGDISLFRSSTLSNIKPRLKKTFSILTKQSPNRLKGAETIGRRLCTEQWCDVTPICRHFTRG